MGTLLMPQGNLPSHSRTVMNKNSTGYYKQQINSNIKVKLELKYTDVELFSEIFGKDAKQEVELDLVFHLP